MPLRSHSGPLPAPTEAERTSAAEIRRHVEALAGQIGERNMWRYPSLLAAAEYIRQGFASRGFSVQTQDYEVDGRTVSNLQAEIPGSSRASEIVLVGAHYDSVRGCPGANDNASAVAALLELGRLLRGTSPEATVRLVAFVNEEPPFFQGAQMGSVVYARHARRSGDTVSAMLSLETIGFYSDAPGSQAYPPPFGLLYPDRGNFIAFVGNTASSALVRQCLASFRRHTDFPSQGIAAPAAVPGVGWSDHWSFWQEGYPAVMITDTAPYRYSHYHLPSDTPEKLDYERTARVVGGLARVVSELAGGSP